MDFEAHESISTNRSVSHTEQESRDSKNSTSTASSKKCTLTVAGKPAASEKSSSTSNVSFCGCFVPMRCINVPFVFSNDSYCF